MSYLKDIVFGALILSSFWILISDAKIFKYIFEDTESVAKCILAVADGDVHRRPTVIISNGENIEDSVNTIEDAYVRALTQILSRAYIPQIVINNWQYLCETIDEYEENILIVLIINSCNSLSNLNETINEDYKYLIVIDNEELNTKCKLDREQIGRTLQHQDATFIVRGTKTSEYNLLTTIPEINETNCEYDNRVLLTLVNTCSNGKLNNRIVFPSKKPKNLKRCEFHVGMATMYPYAMANNRESLRNLQVLKNSQIYGSDVEIIKIISNYYNASLKMYFIYREEGSPYLHLEYVPFLLNGSLDACAGGLYRLYEDFVYYSGIYTRQAVIWVYAVEREPKSWQTVVTKINGLYIFVLFYIGYSIIWILFCNFDGIPVSIRNTFLYSWGALMGTSSLSESLTWKQKILNISYLLLCIHLSAYFSVQLYSFFTIQRPPQILKTNDDVMESGRMPYLNYDTKYFVEDAKYKAFANTSEDCANFQDCEEKTLLNKGLTVVPEGYFHPLQALTAVNYEARMMRAWENIFVVYHEMIVRRDSPVAGKFQLIVQRLFEAGICDRLYLEAIGLLIQAKAENANANILANSYSCESGCSISISQIALAIYIWLIGCGLSFIAFIIEVVMKNKLP